ASSARATGQAGRQVPVIPAGRPPLHTVSMAGGSLTGKHSLSLARGIGPWPVMPVRAGLGRWGGGCLGGCDGVAECFALADEGVGPGRGGGGPAEGALEVGVALAGLAGAAPGPGLDGARG